MLSRNFFNAFLRNSGTGAPRSPAFSIMEEFSHVSPAIIFAVIPSSRACLIINGAVAIEGSSEYAGGYDVEIAKIIAAELGKELVIVKTEWDGLIPALTSGKIDAIIAGMSPTEERKEAIDFTATRGLFNGVGNGMFDPNGQMTRAMFITVIARLDGADLSGFVSSKFTDVPAGSWYCNSVEWAANAGIVNGTGNGKFSPDEPITREQMAVMLYNYLSYKGYTLKTLDENPQPFSDSASISRWAQHSVESMCSMGIILGKPGNLFDPQGNATRAECSMVFKRIIEEIIAQSNRG